MKFGLSKEVNSLIREISKKYKYTMKIFGSRATGKYRVNSDIDIAVFGEVSKQDKFNIMNDFDLLNIPYKIDLVFVSELEKEELIKEIQTKGVKI